MPTDSDPMISIDENLEREVAALFDATRPTVPPFDVAAVTDRPAPSPSSPSPSQSLWSRVPMKVRLASVLALAAVVVAAAVLFTPPTPSVAAVRFDDVREEVGRTRTVVFEQETTVAGERTGERAGEKTVETISVFGPNLVRMDREGGWAVTDFAEKRGMAVDEEAKVARVFESLGPLANLDSDYDHTRWFRDLATGKSEPLPERMIDGQRAAGFRVTRELPGIDEKTRPVSFDVWVDPATKLPVRAEFEDEKVTVVQRGFRFDVELDEARFRLEPPEGYRVERFGTRKLQDVDPDEEAKLVVELGVGIGTVRFGDDKETIVKALGEPDRATPFGQSESLDYHSRGFGLLVGGERGLMMITCQSQKGVAVRIRDFAGRTKHGVRIGSTEDEVREAYGEPSSVTDDTAEGGLRTLYFDDRAAWFALWGGKVNSFVVRAPRKAG